MSRSGDAAAVEAWEGSGPGTLQAYTLGDAPVPPLPVAGIRFAYCAPAQLAALAAAMREPVATVRARLEEGGRAALAQTLNGQIAGYGWIRYGAIQIDDLGYRLPLPGDQAYIWDCLTMPDLRGHGIFPALLRFMLEALRREGIRQVWAGVAPGNVASLRSFERAGFRAVAHLGLIGGAPRVRPLPGASVDEIAVLTGRATG